MTIDDNQQQQDAAAREAKELMQNTARMETRMKILSDHNVQLEGQLNRLKELLVTEMSVDPQQHPEAADPVSTLITDSNRNFGTLQSKDVIASELDVSAKPEGALDNRPNPPPSRQFTEMAGQVGKEIYELVTSLRKRQKSGGGASSGGGGGDVAGKEDDTSLGLSDHETQRVLD